MSTYRAIQLSSTSVSIYFRVAAPSTGLETTIAYNSSGITAKYVRDGAAAVAITLATQTVSGAWSSGGLVDCGGGVVRLDVPDAAFASSGAPKAVTIFVYGLTDKFVESVTVPLVAYDPYTAPDILGPLTAIGIQTTAIKAKTDQFVFTTTNRVDSTVSGGAFPTVDQIRIGVWNSMADATNGYTMNKVMQILLTDTLGDRVTAAGLTSETITMPNSLIQMVATFANTTASDGVTKIYNRTVTGLANLSNAA